MKPENSPGHDQPGDGGKRSEMGSGEGFIASRGFRRGFLRLSRGSSTRDKRFNLFHLDPRPGRSYGNHCGQGIPIAVHNPSGHQSGLLNRLELEIPANLSPSFDGDHARLVEISLHSRGDLDFTFGLVYAVLTGRIGHDRRHRDFGERNPGAFQRAAGFHIHHSSEDRSQGRPGLPLDELVAYSKNKRPVRGGLGHHCLGTRLLGAIIEFFSQAGRHVNRQDSGESLQRGEPHPGGDPLGTLTEGAITSRLGGDNPFRCILQERRKQPLGKLEPQAPPGIAPRPHSQGILESRNSLLDRELIVQGVRAIIEKTHICD